MSDTSNYRDYVTDGKIGIDLTATYASLSAGSTIIYPHRPGDRCNGNNNSTYVFCRAQSDITQYSLVGFNSFADSSLSSDAARAPVLACANVSVTLVGPAGALGMCNLGIAQVSIASSYYGWIAISGSALRVNALAAASSNPKVMLFASTTGGVVTTGTASSACIDGLTLNTSATSASAPWCYANFPRIIQVQTSST
jgi:hypothetical protein